jgi:hypothetical protein
MSWQFTARNQSDKASPVLLLRHARVRRDGSVVRLRFLPFTFHLSPFTFFPSRDSDPLFNQRAVNRNR